MTYLFRKFIRELRSMKFRGLLIVLSIGLSIGIYGGLLLVKDNAFASRNQVLADTNYEDGRLELYNFAPEQLIASYLHSIDGVASLDYRLTLSVTLSFSGENFPAMLHNIHGSRRPLINDFIIKSGDYYSGPSDKVIVEQRFAEANNLHVGDLVSVSYGNLTVQSAIQAIAFAPEHMYSMNPTTSLPEKGVFAPIWFDLDTLMNQLNSPVLINEVLVKLKDKSQTDTVLNHMITKLKDNGYSSFAMRGDQEIDYVMMREDVGTLDKFAVAIGIITLIVAIFIIYDSLLKIISSQTTLIGIMEALGASTRDLFVHYISFGMTLAILGIVVGIPLGYIITLSSTGIFVNAIGFELTTNIFRISSFIPSIVLTLGISFLASVIGTAKIISLRPVEAINDQKIKQFDRKYFVENFFDRFSTNKYSMRIPVRQVFRRKKRSIMTAVTIALAAMIILSSYGFLDSFFHQMDNFYVNNNTADMEMSLVDPVPIQSITDQIAGLDHIQNYEGFIRQPLYIYGDHQNESSIIYAYQSSSQMRHYTFKQGSLVQGEVAIGQILAEKLGVSVGDDIKILTRGKSQFDAVKLNYRISGITQEFFDNFVFINLADLQHDLGFGNMVNAVAIQTNADSEQVKSSLYETDLPISTVIDLEQSKTSFKSLMEAVISFAYFVIFLGIIVLILFSLNVVVLDIIDREREFINLMINGASNWLIAKIIILQTLLISILVLIIDYAITPFFTQFIIDQTMRTMAFIAFYMKPLSYGFGLLSFVAGVSVGLFSAINQITNANIVEVMRLRFKN